MHFRDIKVADAHQSIISKDWLDLAQCALTKLSAEVGASGRALWRRWWRSHSVSHALPQKRAYPSIGYAPLNWWAILGLNQ